jgi:hypothetical protein
MFYPLELKIPERKKISDADNSIRSSPRVWVYPGNPEETP